MVDDWQTWLHIPLVQEETILDIADGLVEAATS